MQTFGTTAEIGPPGVSSQLIVKSGGNQFTGRYTERFMHSRLQSSNIDAALSAQNIREGNSIRYYNQLTADLGGPIVEDRAWFYVAFHDLRNERNQPAYSSGRGPDGVYAPPTISRVSCREPPKIRLPKSHTRLTPTTSSSDSGPGLPPSTTAPGPAGLRQKSRPTVSCRRPIRARRSGRECSATTSTRTPCTPRLIYAATGRFIRPVGRFQIDLIAKAGSRPVDRSTKHRLPAPRRRIANGSVNYFPRGSYAGSHEIVAGYALMWGVFDTSFPAQPNGNYRLVYDNVGGRSGRPVEFHAHDFPVAGASNQNLFVGYVSDSWRPSDRMTVNLGLRFERNDTYVGAQVKEQGQFGNAGSFPRIDVGTWNAFAPRLGVAYDLSGNGKTVLKATYGKYNHDWGYSFAHTYKPEQRLSDLLPMERS